MNYLVLVEADYGAPAYYKVGGETIGSLTAVILELMRFQDTLYENIDLSHSRRLQYRL